MLTVRNALDVALAKRRAADVWILCAFSAANRCTLRRKML